MPGCNNSTNRRVKVLVVAALVAVGVIAAVVLTVRSQFSEENLIAYAVTRIEDLTGVDFIVGQAELDPSRELIFRNVAVALSSDMRAQGHLRDPRLLEADAVSIVFERKGPFKLKARLRTILIDRPVLHLTRRADSSQWNWQALFAGPQTGFQARRSFGVGPKFELRNGRIELTELGGPEPRPLGALHFSIRALPRGDRYRIALKTWTDNARGPAATFDLDPRTGRILVGEIPAIPWRDLEPAIPQPYRDRCRQFAPAGTIAISDVTYDPADGWHALVQLAEVAAKVPISENNWPVNLADLTARIRIAGEELRIEQLAGTVNTAPCRLSGQVRLDPSDPKNPAFKLHAVAKRFPCPNYLDPVDRDMIETALPRKLRNVLHDFKPVGRVDLDLTVVRTAGPDGRTTVTGTVMPDHTSLEYRRFPYRVDDVTGTVALAADGSIALKDLHAETPTCAMTLDGRLSAPSKHARIDIQAVFRRIAVDQKLHDALPLRHQRIWKMFNPTGWARADVHLARPPGPGRKWTRTIRADLFDTAATYEKFKYALTDLAGKLIINSESLELAAITGRHGGGTVTITGRVDRLNTPKPNVHLELAGRDIQIDEDLIAALPEPAARIVTDCRLAGTTDLTGAITVRGDTPWRYRFRCDLKNAAVCYKDFPYAVDDLQGRLIITPDRVDIDGAFAEKGSQTIRAKGRLKLGHTGHRIDLTIDADNVPINSQLYQALDPRQQAIWKNLNPAGNINVHAQLVRETDQPWTWTLNARLDHAQIQYDKLPKLTNLTGNVRFAPDHADFDRIVGKTPGGGTVACSGRIVSDDKTIRSTLALRVDNLPVTADLVDAAPRTIRNTLDWQAGGRLACQFDQLDIVAPLDDPSRQRWTLKGRLAGTGVTVASLADKPVDLTYRGTMQWAKPAATFALDGHATVTRFDWKQRHVTDIACGLKKLADTPRLNVTPLQGRVGGGQLTGFAELTFQGPRTEYGIQLTLQDLPAEQVLFVDPDTPAPLRGKIRGEVYLLGILGDKYAQRGGGHILISTAKAGQTPLMTKLYEAAKQTPPALANFRDVSIQFILERHAMDLVHIDLTGRTLSMLGYGTVNLSNDRLKLHLILAGPGRLKKLPLIRDLIQRAHEDLTEVQVSGTIQRPVTKATPLRQLSDTLRSFLEGKRAFPEPPRRFQPR